MHSCMYIGSVSHRRHGQADGVDHRFRYSLWWSYLDLAEIPDLRRRGLLSRRRWGAAAFVADRHQRDAMEVADALGSGASNVDPIEESGDEQRLDQALRCRVERCLGWRPTGPIRMLTQLSHFGIYFSPLTIYYLFDQQERVVASVAEVNNTPWGEQHSYVLASTPNEQDKLSFPARTMTTDFSSGNPPSSLRPQSENGSTSVLEPKPKQRGALPELNQCEHEKTFHVSPFMEMERRYRWRFGSPREDLSVQIESVNADGVSDFDATMNLRRKKLSRGNQLRCLCRRPMAPLWMLGAIYFEALRLWIKRVPFVPHPRKREEPRNVA